MWRWLADLAEEHARLRTTGAKQKQTISPEEADALIGRALVSALASDEETRLSGDLLNDEYRELHASVATSHAQEVARHVALGGGSEGVRMAAADWLINAGYDIPEGSDEFRVFAHKFARAMGKGVEIARERDAGRWPDAPPVPQVAPPSASSSPLLSVVVSEFLAKQNEDAPMFKK